MEHHQFKSRYYHEDLEQWITVDIITALIEWSARLYDGQYHIEQRDWSLIQISDGVRKFQRVGPWIKDYNSEKELVDAMRGIAPLTQWCIGCGTLSDFEKRKQWSPQGYKG